MRSKKNQSNFVPAAPIFREIPAAAPAPAPTPAQEAAETLRDLNRYAADVQQFLRTSKMKTILDGLQSDLNRATGAPRMRLRRD